MILSIPLLAYRIPIRLNIYQVQALAGALDAHIERLFNPTVPMNATEILELEAFMQLHRYVERQRQALHNRYQYATKPVSAHKLMARLSLPLPRWMLLHETLIFAEPDPAGSYEFQCVIDLIDETLQQFGNQVTLRRAERIEEAKRKLLSN